jgi:hypothetical protein
MNEEMCVSFTCHKFHVLYVDFPTRRLVTTITLPKLFEALQLSISQKTHSGFQMPFCVLTFHETKSVNVVYRELIKYC